MRTVEPSEQKLQEFLSESVDDRNVLMVNLLRFNEQAQYTSLESTSPVDGKTAYQRYSGEVVKLVWEVGGQVLWIGKVRSNFIMPSEEEWDEFMLVYYPSRSAFVRMIQSEAYGKIVHHRTAALKDSRLIETVPREIPRWVLRTGRWMIQMKSLFRPQIA
jgi:uncharacterized protein (DUF1330 family)